MQNKQDNTMKIKILVALMLLALCLPAAGQVHGSMQQIGSSRILQLWGTHYERGYAQGYLLAPEIMTVFNDFYWMMYTYSDQAFYNQLQTFSQQHFNYSQQMYFEAVGMAEGMASSGTNIHHNGLGRDLATDDILLLNTVYDMVTLQGGRKDAFKLGCASLSSWGVATQSDSLLAGSSVITRFLDTTQNSALIANPLLVVHHPSESNEQTWLGFTFPGMFCPMTVISSTGIFASLNTGSDNYAPDPTNLSPILWDLRKGVEVADYDQNGAVHVHDVYAAIASGNHLSGTIIHVLQESGGVTGSIVIETRNGITQFRNYNQNGNLPTHHLAATNHFRLIANPACCNRYTLIQDSLYANPHMDAKRQWRVLSGAAGLETNLSAVQFIPSTGALLWAAASLSEPAYLRPGLQLDTQELFSYATAVHDPQQTPAPTQVSIYPNPWNGAQDLKLSASSPVTRVEVFNLKGQKVLAFTPTLPQQNLRVMGSATALPAGIYFLKTSFTQGQPRVQKFILHPDK